MYIREINPQKRKYYLMKKARSKKRNLEASRHIDIFVNAWIDDYIISHDDERGSNWSQQQTLSAGLLQLNREVVYKNYAKLMNSKYVDSNAIEKILIRNQANEEALNITNKQLERINKNIKAIDDVMTRYEVNIDKYRKLSERYSKRTSRKGIITESIDNLNYITSSGRNIRPNVFGYHELSHLTEFLYRQSEMQSKYELNIKNDEYKSKIWIWTGSGKTTRHQSNDGKTVGVDDLFEIVNDATGEVDMMRFPLDPNASFSNAGICYCEIEFSKEEPPN